MATPSSLQYGTLPSAAKGDIKPFKLHIEEEAVENLKQLIKLSPVAKECYENEEHGDLNLGVTRKWILDAKKQWETDFDWRKHESYINSFPQFKTQIQDDDGHVFDIHFTALFSQKADAIPIVLFHGWPGSFLEFLPMMDLLRQKHTPLTLPYNIIVPSLPGFTLSSAAPKTKPWAMEDTTRILHKLTLSLGYPSYIVQGGDIGAGIARMAAVAYPECTAAHINHAFMPPPASCGPIHPLEQAGIQRYHDFADTGTAYGRMHGTRPSTIGIALSASPLALLAWIADKFLEWSDPATAPSVDNILAHVSLYWFTNCFPTAIYTYRRDFVGEREEGYLHGIERLRMEKPLGYSWYKYELAPVPTAWVEKTGKLVWSARHEKGGHFAALERPDVFLEDLEGFVGVVQNGA